MKLELLHHAPTGGAAKRTILLVHGAWHGAWCWEPNYLPYLAQHGYDSYALSLRGHGQSEGRERLRWFSAADYVADIEGVVSQLPAPPVLVGHSMGGFVVQKYLEKHTTPAAVLLASIPHSGIIGFQLRALRYDLLAVLQALGTLSLYPLMGTPERLRHWCFSRHTPQALIDRFFPLVQDEALRMLFETLFLALPKVDKVRSSGTPLLVLSAAEDHIFPLPEQQSLARAYGLVPEIFPDMGHDMMLEPGWQATADRIMAWLENLTR